MPDLRIPLGRYARRIFAFVVCAAIALIVLVRFLLIPAVFGDDPPDVASLLDESLGDILSTVIAAAVLSAVVVWLTAPAKKRTDFNVVHPKDIGKALDDALTDARSWHYNGSVGRWNRSTVLPRLASAARRNNSTRSCRLIVMDPRDARVCEAYAEYRSGLRTGSQGTWDVRSVRADLCATIVAVARYKGQEPLLDIRLFVKRSSPVYRVDASDRQMILTREDPAEPGLACQEDTHFFDAFMEGVNFDAKQAEELRLLEDGFSRNEVVGDAVRRVLDAAGIDIPEVESEEFLREVAGLVRDAKDPYVT